MLTLRFKRLPLLYLLFILPLLLITTLIDGKAFANNCPSLKSPKEVIDCALINHPGIRISEAEIQAVKTLDEVAKQRPNPEVNSQTVWSNTGGVPYFYTEYNFAHTFELGGKRDSRIAKANAELNKEQANKLATKERVYLETLLALFRLRQLKNEISTVQDALDTFNQIQKQYRSRPRLMPDQQATLRLFELAGSDYKMRIIPLQIELEHHLRRLEISLGRTFNPTDESLPKQKKDWPTLPTVSKQKDLNGASIRVAEADLKLAASDLSLAKSIAWSDFKIGPTYEIQKSPGQNFNAYGFNFILPLPFYHTNEAGKSYSNLEIKKNEIVLDIVQREALEEREHYGHIYERAVEAIKGSPSPNELHKKHEEVEGLFSRGLIPGNLVIELHRQIHDFSMTLNRQETAAAEALTRIYILEGKLPEEIIW